MILDASAFVRALGDRRSPRAISGQDLAAPDLLVPETLNAFWKLARAGQSVPKQSLILRFLDQIRIVPSRMHAQRAAELADELDHSVYDCLYLALAESEGDVLLTADAVFVNKLLAARYRDRVRVLTTNRS